MVLDAFDIWDNEGPKLEDADDEDVLDKELDKLPTLCKDEFGGEMYETLFNGDVLLTELLLDAVLLLLRLLLRLIDPMLGEYCK